MRRAYAHSRGFKTRAALVFCILLAAACGSTGKTAPKPADTTAELIRKAGAEERQRRYDRASALYQRALDEAPDKASRAHAARSFASALLFWGKTEDARPLLETTVELRPNDVGSWHDLGVVRANLGDPAGAERALERSIELSPRDPRSRIALAALFVNEKRYAEATEHYRTLLELELPERMRDAVKRALELLSSEQTRSESP